MSFWKCSKCESLERTNHNLRLALEYSEIQVRFAHQEIDEIKNNSSSARLAELQKDLRDAWFHGKEIDRANIELAKRNQDLNKQVIENWRLIEELNTKISTLTHPLRMTVVKCSCPEWGPMRKLENSDYCAIHNPYYE